MNRLFLALLVAMVTCAKLIAQTVIVNETFDNYANEAALHAVWAGLQGGTGYPVFTPPATPAQVEERFELVTQSASNADFNNNTRVDAADYTLWRNNLGLMGTATRMKGDANGDMNVDSADYDLWKSTFGSTPIGGSGGKYVRHLANQTVTANRVPDGNLVYLPPLDPNFQPDNSIFPSVGLEPIVLSGDIYAGSPDLQRNSIGLRSFFDGASSNLVEMGFYNGVGSQPANTAAGAAADGTDLQSQSFAGFGARLQLFDSSTGGAPNPDWQFFALPSQFDTNGNGLVTQSEVFTKLGAGWHHFEVTIAPSAVGTGHDITFTLDLLNDGINNGTLLPGVDATLTYVDVVTVGQAGFNSLRLGGPSGLPTAGEFGFDNIYLSGPLVTPGAGAVVPEPSSIAALFALIGVLSGVRSRRLSV